MNEIHNETNENLEAPPKKQTRRHPYTIEHSKEEMFRRMGTVDERIAAFLEKLDADRKKNAR